MSSFEAYDPYNVFQYPWMAVNLFVALWAISVVTYKMLSQVSVTKTQFLCLEEGQRRNVVIYIFQLVVTTSALGLQIFGGRDFLFRGEDYTSPERIDACRLAMMLIVALYIWELVYRISIRLPLATHHVMTILFLQLGYGSFIDTMNIVYLRFGILLSLYATTEQFSFVALFLYRLKICSQSHSLMFYIAAIQAFCTKTFITVCAVAFYWNTLSEGRVSHDGAWGGFWKVTFLFLLSVLFATQVYASWVLYILAKRSQQRRTGSKISRDDAQITESTLRPDNTGPKEASLDFVDCEAPKTTTESD